MAQDVITNAIMIIAAIIAVVVLVNAAMPALFAATSSMTGATAAASDRAGTDIRLSMTSAQSPTVLKVWAKNVGSTAVPGSRINATDVYFGERGSMVKASVNQSATVRWIYTIDETDGNGDWNSGETVEITITDASGQLFAPGEHLLKLVLFNAASFEDAVSI